MMAASPARQIRFAAGLTVLALALAGLVRLALPGISDSSANANPPTSLIPACSSCQARHSNRSRLRDMQSEVTE